MTGLVRFLMPVAVAIVLGPLIAGIAVSVLAITSAVLDRTAAVSIVDLFKMSIVYISFAYIAGSMIALLTGLLISLWMLRRQPNLPVVIAAAAIATAAYMGVAALGIFGPAEYTNSRSNFLFTLVCAVIAATVCWPLVKRFAKAA